MDINILMYINMLHAGFCLAPSSRELLRTSVEPSVTERAAGFGSSAFGAVLQ